MQHKNIDRLDDSDAGRLLEGHVEQLYGEDI